MLPCYYKSTQLWLQQLKAHFCKLKCFRNSKGTDGTKLVYVVVWFNLSLNFNFLCFKTHYHKLPYMKAKENNSLNQG